MMTVIRCLINTLAVFGILVLIGIFSLLAFFILKFIFIAIVVDFILWFVLAVIYYGFKELYDNVQKTK
nr:MAG TPA: hypothetical protein [Caudoviricetes sp.]